MDKRVVWSTCFCFCFLLTSKSACNLGKRCSSLLWLFWLFICFTFSCPSNVLATNIWNYFFVWKTSVHVAKGHANVIRNSYNCADTFNWIMYCGHCFYGKDKLTYRWQKKKLIFSYLIFFLKYLLWRHWN